MTAAARPLAPPPHAVADDGLDGILALTERLDRILMQEDEALKNGNVAALSAGQEEKHRLVATYAHEMGLLAADRTRLERADPAKRARLKALTAKFRQTIEENARRVGAMKTVSERLIKAVGDEVARRNRPVRGYDDKAKMRPAIMASGMAPPPTSIALNQVI